LRINIYLALIFLTPLNLVACSQRSTIKSAETAVNVSGTVTYLQHIALPSDAVVHVILSDVTSSTKPIAIAEQTISQPGPSPILFEINYDSTTIDPEHTYSVQACIRADDQVRFVSIQPYPVITKGHTDKVQVTLASVENLQTQTMDPDQISESADTPLQQSIDVTLAGKCRVITTRYDRITQARASEILPPKLLSGSHHKVREDVVIRGPQYYFVVASDFGQYQAQGRPRLRRLVREINAIAALKEITKTESFKDSFSDSALEPVAALKELVVNPADTITGVPKGLWTFVAGSKQSVTGGRSQYEDHYLDALVTVSKYKRRYAAELGIDVYTSTPEVQKELNRLGWAAAIANWTPSVLLLPAAGPAKTLYTVFDWTKTLNRIVTEAAPDVLRYRNNNNLEAMGISVELRNRFLSHNYYSPRNQTVITEYLASMTDAKEKERVIEQALKANSEIDAFTYQQIVEILAGYNRSVAPIIELRVHQGIPVGYAKNGSLVMGFPVDLGRWTAFSEHLFVDFGKNPPETEEIKKPELWILGELTPRARRKFEKLGIYVTANAGSKVGMMD
jgi:uncharacterized lipoprotein YbaY